MIDPIVVKNTYLLFARLALSFYMIYLHGYTKLFNFSEVVIEFPNPLGVGAAFSLTLVIFAEFFCSIFLAIGLFTRYAVVPLIITMAVATWVINGGRPLVFQEKSFMYLLLYISFLVTGAGKYSIDYLKKN